MGNQENMLCSQEKLLKQKYLEARKNVLQGNHEKYLLIQEKLVNDLKKLMNDQDELLMGKVKIDVRARKINGRIKMAG